MIDTDLEPTYCFSDISDLFIITTLDLNINELFLILLHISEKFETIIDQCITRRTIKLFLYFTDTVLRYTLNNCIRCTVNNLFLSNNSEFKTKI